WFGHIQRRPVDAPVRRSDQVDLGTVKRGKGMPKLTWLNLVQNDLSLLDLPEELVTDRVE
ncbi:hypothetical protein, partial [Escherichia coli]|uniref:hypothetical protein n=1 Tax=Escherichia coli TaxID=562 RepID=UPI003F4803F7